MKKSIWLALFGILAASLSVAADLTLEQQRGIIERYMYATGQTPTPPASLVNPATGRPLPGKCATPAILDFQRNFDRLDRRLMQALGVEDVARPVRDTSYGVPGGHTLIHYDTVGENAPWQVRVDSDNDGVPDYVESVAMIADSCYVHEVEKLGYPRPLVDSLCTNGGDERLDIYIDSLGEGQYGATYSEFGCPGVTTQHQGAWIVIDRDFQQLPAYENRPLDGARVTLAHEIFHSIQFNIDITEHVTWMEMSAVWMEEEIYDQINDYYLFDYIFFDNPRAALQDTTISFHMYEAVFFPIYLSEKYGAGAIKEVWLHAEALGDDVARPDYLRAIDSVVVLASQDPANAQYRCLCRDDNGGQCLDSVLIRQDLASAMAEFAVWNFFTGPYASQAPNGIGYSEAAYYSSIPLDSIDIRRVYPTSTVTEPALPPAPNGAAYIRLENLQSVNFDSLLTMFIYPDSRAIVRWGVTGIFQMEEQPDSHVVVSEVVDAWETWVCLDSVCDSMNGGNCVTWSCVDSALYPGRYLGDMIGEWVCTDGQFGTTLPCGPSTCSDSVRVIGLQPLRSLTLIMTPSTPNFGPYPLGHIPINFFMYDSSHVDLRLADLAPAVLTPYPNPAVVSEMGGQELAFRFRASTDSLSFASLTNPILQLDIYSVAGELVRTLEVPFGDDRYGPRPGGGYEIGWDMKNQAGKDVASGVYLAIARLFEDGRRKIQLAEKQVKVAVIR